MDDEQRRREFVSNEANVEHAVNEAAETKDPEHGSPDIARPVP